MRRWKKMVHWECLAKTMGKWGTYDIDMIINMPWLPEDEQAMPLPVNPAEAWANRSGNLKFKISQRYDAEAADTLGFMPLFAGELVTVRAEHPVRSGGPNDAYPEYVLGHLRYRNRRGWIPTSLIRRCDE